MTALLQSELIKLRTTRTFAALAGVTVLLSVLIAGLVAALTEPTRDNVLYEVYASDVSSLFILLLAVVGITGEWRHHTISGSLLAAPDRARFLAAKVIAFAAAGLVLSVVCSVAIGLVATGVLWYRDLPLADLGELVAQDGRSALVSALTGAFGVGVGALVRSQALTLVGLLVAVFVAEPLLWTFAEDVAPYSPLVGLPNAISDLTDESEIALHSPVVATVLMLVWIAGISIVGALLLQRRDVE